MEEGTRIALEELREALADDLRLKKLEEAERKLNASEEVASLSQKAKEALSAYAYNRDHFGSVNELTRSAQHEAYLAKKALDEHPLSKEYNAAFKEVRILYDELDGILLSPYREKLNCRRGKES